MGEIWPDIDSHFDNLVVKIQIKDSANESGSGIIVNLSKDSPWIYVITARHCLVGLDLKSPRKPLLEDVQVLNFLSDESGTQDPFLPYSLIPPNDDIFYPEPKMLDICLLRLSKSRVQAHLQKEFLVLQGIDWNLSNLKLWKACAFSGFPLSFDAKKPIAIKGQLFNIQQNAGLFGAIPDHQMGTLWSKSLDNARGFSGSGIFLTGNNAVPRLFGIITDFYHDKYEEFVGIGLADLQPYIMQHEPITKLPTGLKLFIQSINKTLLIILNDMKYLHIVKQELAYLRSGDTQIWASIFFHTEAKKINNLWEDLCNIPHGSSQTSFETQIADKVNQIKSILSIIKIVLKNLSKEGRETNQYNSLVESLVSLKKKISRLGSECIGFSGNKTMRLKFLTIYSESTEKAVSQLVQRFKQLSQQASEDYLSSSISE